jgi:hypothetical protein
MMLVAELIVLAIFLVVGVVALANGAGRGFALTPLYDSSTFSLGLVFGAVSIAVLSFLGVVVNAQVAAQTLGFVWLVLGIVVLVVLLATGRRPTMAVPCES